MKKSRRISAENKQKHQIWLIFHVNAYVFTAECTGEGTGEGTGEVCSPLTWFPHTARAVAVGSKGAENYEFWWLFMQKVSCEKKTPQIALVNKIAWK